MSNSNDTLLQYSQEALNDLGYIVSRGTALSIESASLPLVDTLKASFQEYLTSLSTFLNGLKVSNYKKQTIDAKELIEHLQTYDYRRARLLEVAVPAGFIGKWVPFLEMLLKDVLPPVASADTTLRLINTRLATALNEPTRLKAQSGIRDLTNKVALIDEKDFNAIKGAFGNHSKSAVTLSAVAERNADVDRAYQLINKLNAELGSIDFSGIQKLIDRLSEMTQSLKSLLQQEDHNEMSGLVTSQLSDLFFKVGMTITAGALLIDITEQLTTSMQSSRDMMIQGIGQTAAE